MGIRVLRHYGYIVSEKFATWHTFRHRRIYLSSFNSNARDLIFLLIAIVRNIIIAYFFLMSKHWPNIHKYPASCGRLDSPAYITPKLYSQNFECIMVNKIPKFWLERIKKLQFKKKFCPILYSPKLRLEFSSKWCPDNSLHGHFPSQWG